MRSFPIDSDRINLIFAGSVMPKPLFEDGKRVEGRQVTDDYGTPVWIMDCIVDVDEESNDRTEIIGVAVSSPVQPVVKKWTPVRFENLEAGVYLDRRTNQIKQTFRASGIKEA